MNRDYIKLESQEIQALVTKVIQEWQPDIWVDTHHGGSAPYTLTYQTNMNPAGDQGTHVAFGNERILLARAAGAARRGLRRLLVHRCPASVDGVAGLGADLGGAAQAACLRATLSKRRRLPLRDAERLAPAHQQRHPRWWRSRRMSAIKHQVRGQYIGQRELIRFAAENGDANLKAGGARRARSAPSAWQRRRRQRPDRLGVRAGRRSSTTTVHWRRVGGAWRVVGQAVGGASRRDRQYELVNGPIFTKWEPTRTTTRPWGYMLPPSMTKLVPLLLEHDITVKRLTEPVDARGRGLLRHRDGRTTQYFQAHYLKAVNRREAHRDRLIAGRVVLHSERPADDPTSSATSWSPRPTTTW